MASADRFGYEWDVYSEIIPEYELQFRKWVSPLTEADFSGKKVLDAGCGMGRNSYWVLRWGAYEVVAFDADERSVAAAAKNLEAFPNARVLLKSIYDINWKNEFDVAFSIGVIHHLKDPLLGVRKITESVRPGGTVLVWVYGYEGNEWVVRYISPLRRAVTSRIPARLLHYLTYAFSLPFYAFIQLAPSANPYFVQLKRFRFWHVHSIIFDQLLPSIANYYTREEARDLLTKAGVSDVSLVHVNGNSWAVKGVKR